jgi:uncharacterized hydrophobic protein (TIGR00271 family)
MIEKLADVFHYHEEREEFGKVIETISGGVDFRGPTLWILIFAVFIASLGLNTNSTAVIIGAMLISPLMGPILGIGLGAGINDLSLVKRALKNYTYAVIVGLVTSTLYFAISPLSEAYSELLARTSPTLYDVLIAFFGGLAGITATTSRQKGNVIAGAAIATALMPPLCTAGYGLAAMKFNFVLGALYLFTINTVFIALATLITVRLLKFPVKHANDPHKEIKNRRIITAIIIITLIPSIYSGYLMIQQNKFTRQAQQFVEAFSSVEGDYLLNKEINADKREITLVYAGNEIKEAQISLMKDKLKVFGLENAGLIVKQGFSFLEAEKENSKILQLSRVIQARELEISELKKQLSIVKSDDTASAHIKDELKILFPKTNSIAFAKFNSGVDSKGDSDSAVLIKTNEPFPGIDKKRITQWLKKRLGRNNLTVYFSR